MTTMTTMAMKAGARPRVLIVDDEKAMLISMEALLDEDYSVTTAASVLLARAAMAAGEFDVVLADYQLPDGSGLALLQEVHARFPGCVGILITGHAEHPEVKAARANWREFNVLLKPYSPLDLISLVKNAARIARLRKATRRLAIQIQKGGT